MNSVERFKAVMNFQKPDRLPMIEWAHYWDKTVDRWHGEGLPAELVDAAEIRRYLGLDCYHQLWTGTRKDTCPSEPHHGAGIISDTGGYIKLKEHLYPEFRQQHRHGLDWLADTACRQARGEVVFWISLDGFFWFPRVLLGIENHLYAFYDQPELMHAINRDLTDFHLRTLDSLCEICTPLFMTFGEDMSYNHGPMLSKTLFDEFIAPYYRRIVPALKERGIIPMIDSDGDVTTLIPWLEEAGIEGLLPLERQSGVDVAQIRRCHPRFRMIGAFDKMVMNRGEQAIRGEFERLLPVMRTGGFIPSVDHQTPPGVSLEQYKCYLRLLKEYAELGAG